METYTHVMPAVMREAADAMHRALRPKSTSDDQTA
jgi:hypothetical protein